MTKMTYTAKKETYIIKPTISVKKCGEKYFDDHPMFPVYYLHLLENGCGSLVLQKPSCSLHQSLLQTEKGATLLINLLFYVFQTLHITCVLGKPHKA